MSTYPGRPWQIAHAVGLDALASAKAILQDLGHLDGELDLPLEDSLRSQRLFWPVAEYQAALKLLPASMRRDLQAIWGDVKTDPLVQDTMFVFPALRIGQALVALPERGIRTDRDADYHDISRVPVMDM